MKLANLLLLSFLMLVVVGGSVGFTQTKAVGNAEALDPLPRELEVRWALSAIPPYLRSNATVYILDPAKGYVLAHQGANGFNCFVERTDYVREEYRKDLIYPLCFDPEGSRTIMPVSFDVARIRAEGKVSPVALHQEIMRKFKDDIYHSPARPGISYMLSPVARLYGGPGSNGTRSMNMPHYMFYGPNLTSKDFGGGPPLGPYPYLINAGPHAYMILNVGEAETKQINHESQDLIKDLCAFQSDLCIEGASAVHSPPSP
jgi:hypothetical protein